MQTITKFYFDRARYLVGDDSGNEVYLEMDYKNAKFEMQMSKSVNQQFLEKVEQVAKDLLVRKHGVNFSDRIQI